MVCSILSLEVHWSIQYLQKIPRRTIESQTLNAPKPDIIDSPNNRTEVNSSLKILKNMFNNNPVLGSRVGLKTANYANCEADIRPSAKHSIHKTSYG